MYCDKPVTASFPVTFFRCLTTNILVVTIIGVCEVTMFFHLYSLPSCHNRKQKHSHYFHCDQMSFSPRKVINADQLRHTREGRKSQIYHDLNQNKNTLRENQYILPFARRSVNSDIPFIIVVYDKIFGSMNN